MVWGWGFGVFVFFGVLGGWFGDFFVGWVLVDGLLRWFLVYPWNLGGGTWEVWGIPGDFCWNLGSLWSKAVKKEAERMMRLWMTYFWS